MEPTAPPIHGANRPHVEVPVVHDSSWDDGHVVAVALRAVVETIVVTETNFNGGLVEATVTLDTAKLLSC